MEFIRLKKESISEEAIHSIEDILSYMDTYMRPVYVEAEATRGYIVLAFETTPIDEQEALEEYTRYYLDRPKDDLSEATLRDIEREIIKRKSLVESLEVAKTALQEAEIPPQRPKKRRPLDLNDREQWYRVTNERFNDILGTTEPRVGDYFRLECFDLENGEKEYCIVIDPDIYMNGMDSKDLERFQKAFSEGTFRRCKS